MRHVPPLGHGREAGAHEAAGEGAEPILDRLQNGIGALFLAVGLFASATSKNQMVAAVVTFFCLLVGSDGT